jgi:hypothetical protein
MLNVDWASSATYRVSKETTGLDMRFRKYTRCVCDLKETMPVATTLAEEHKKGVQVT